MTSLALRTLLKQLNNPPDIKYLTIAAHEFDDGFDLWWIEEFSLPWIEIQPKLQRSEERRILK